MGNVKIELNSEGVRALLRSPEMLAICKSHADAARARLGAGYEVTTYTGKNRVNVQIAAETFAARRENAQGNTILKALRRRPNL